MVAIGGGSVIDAAKAVITDKAGIKVKASRRHANFVPQITILPPYLLRGASDRVLACWRAGVLACCSVDAFTHLFEAYLSARGNTFSRQSAIAGMQAFIRGWPALNRDDATGYEAREQMLLASWLGGQSLSMSGLGVIHGIAGEPGAIKIIITATCAAACCRSSTCWSRAKIRSRSR